MKTRIISGLVMAPLLILVIIGGNCITFLGFLIALMGIHEFFNGFRTMGFHPSYPVAAVSAALLYGVHVGCAYFSGSLPEGSVYLLWLFLSVLMSLLMLFRIEERKLEDAMITITGIVYICFFSYHAVLTESVFGAKAAASPVWLILITAFCTDIFAYFTGYFLGKHKLCPVISPKKTIEGSLGGILGSVVFCMLFGLLAPLPGMEALWMYAVIGVAGGIVSQFGDLTASIFKRKMGIKDYGTLIPGHGGIMDRFDSVLFTAPMVYYVLYLLNFFR
ncbi:MAG: phosphatidate cytidylyltransferase [Anaerovoracaceae bacterium]